jgi:hypothetical protein
MSFHMHNMYNMHLNSICKICIKICNIICIICHIICRICRMLICKIICRLICRICWQYAGMSCIDSNMQNMSKICIICYVDFQYAQYAFPTLLMLTPLIWNPVPLDRIGQSGMYWYVPVRTSIRQYRPVQEFPVGTYWYVPVHTGTYF